MVTRPMVFPEKLVAFSTWIDRTRWARNTWAMAAIIILIMADLVTCEPPAWLGERAPLPRPSSPTPDLPLPELDTRRAPGRRAWARGWPAPLTPARAPPAQLPEPLRGSRQLDGGRRLCREPQILQLRRGPDPDRHRHAGAGQPHGQAHPHAAALGGRGRGQHLRLAPRLRPVRPPAAPGARQLAPPQQPGESGAVSRPAQRHQQPAPGPLQVLDDGDDLRNDAEFLLFLSPCGEAGADAVLWKDGGARPEGARLRDAAPGTRPLVTNMLPDHVGPTLPGLQEEDEVRTPTPRHPPGPPGGSRAHRHVAGPPGVDGSGPRRALLALLLPCPQELYSQAYDEIGVMFASLPNFADFYDGGEHQRTAASSACASSMRFISDFDSLLDNPQFRIITKIKTIGSTYMAASGVTPEANTNGFTSASKEGQSDKERWQHLADLADFALAMKDTLTSINNQSFNNFMLRIGMNKGGVLAGVIGARKPHYDIWGNTVNVASRMESTGVMGNIQVVEETQDILRTFGFRFVRRGRVFVKGKGELLTFFLKGREKVAPFPNGSSSVTLPHQVVDCS
uniref:adenylate cyclase n=1 Tax=Ornithorhynchus anatinus TaxID=9258 RepID=K7E8Y4_ORNAN